jgi:hypothetical protein
MVPMNHELAAMFGRLEGVLQVVMSGSVLSLCEYQAVLKISKESREN